MRANAARREDRPTILARLRKRDFGQLNLEEALIRVTKEFDNTNYLWRAQEWAGLFPESVRLGSVLSCLQYCPQKTYV